MPGSVRDGVSHPKGFKNVLPQERREFLPGDRFHDQRQKGVTGVAVMILFPGGKFQVVLVQQKPKHIAIA